MTVIWARPDKFFDCKALAAAAALYFARGTYVAIMNLIPHYFGRTHYPRILVLALPFSTILGSPGSPVTGDRADSVLAVKSSPSMN